jgi:hypothetical protein
MCYLEIVRLTIQMIYISLCSAGDRKSLERLLDDEIFLFEVHKMLNVFLLGYTYLTKLPLFV